MQKNGVKNVKKCREKCKKNSVKKANIWCEKTKILV